MENNQNRAAQASAANTSYEQDSANRSTTSATANNQQNQNQSQGGVMDSITGAISNIQVPQAVKNIQLPDAVKNIQLPQAVKDFGATCARSYSGLSTTQKVVGGAVLALGASYWAASANGWIGQGKNKTAKRNKGTQHS
ncbi:hypothetical protein [Rufibacter sp. LB8]|uniref:hypothetical protein n=1 Tax=Rufibacter sp. LB8 TaxID=2777781 RepID=UPI00178C59FA|nr:hypothetical protein [Rufibacter sp. LB8]